MRCIKVYRCLNDDQLQSKGKAPLVNRPRQSGFQPRPRKDLRIQEPKLQLREVNMTFKEPVHRIVDRIKNGPYFRWPNKMGVTRLRETKICTVPITGIRGIPPSSAEC